MFPQGLSGGLYLGLRFRQFDQRLGVQASLPFSTMDAEIPVEIRKQLRVSHDGIETMVICDTAGLV
jgi:hypothetical protein